MLGLTSRQLRVLACCSLAAFLAAMDGSALFLVLPAVAAEFHAQLPSLSNLGSIVALGSIGALPLGLLADRRGRRLLLVAGTAGFGLADLASAFAPNLAWLAAARVVAVVFETAVGEISLIVVVEEMAAEHRGLGAAALTLAAGAGAGVITILYPFVAPHWQVLYVAGAAGIPAALVIAWGLPESRAWERARELPPIAWRGGWLRRLAVVVVVAAIADVFYGPVTLFVALYGSRTLGLRPAAISAVVVASGLAGLVAYPVGGWLSDRYGRRGLGVGLAGGNAASAAIGFLGGFRSFVGGNVAFSALSSAAGPVFGAWFAELFPTRARVTAETLDVVAGAVGTVVGLQLLPHLSARLGLGHAIAALALLPLAGCALLLLLPETRGTPLEA